MNIKPLLNKYSMDVTSQKKNENFGTEISYTVTGKIAERHEFKNNMDKG